MSIAELIRKMAEAGATPEAIALAVEAIESKSADVERRREVERERKRRQRAGQSRDSHGTVTAVSGDTPTSSPVPLVPPSQTLPPIIPQTPSPTPETKLARRLPDDWVLPASWGKWALDEGYSEATIRLEADKFGDFWHAKGGKDARKLDWEKTWRNWIRNVPKSRGSPLSQAPPRETDFARHQRECREAIQRKLNGHDDDDQFTGTAFDLEPGNYSAH
ncbi:hypothetical protein CO661_14110 [Sinorhizobium fredii]|uniref:DUF1376 domain-containing protein n=1 Tax=Rhizobium fredii TaxID=380 RepID=A0A2A6LYJ3_RHIFR|nr:hypothetical protein CO661_14110 [Sinorhizobium fredii]